MTKIVSDEYIEMIHSAMKRDREYYACEVFELAGDNIAVHKHIIDLMDIKLKKFFSSYTVQNPALVHFKDVNDHTDDVENGLLFAVLVLSGVGSFCLEVDDNEYLNIQLIEGAFFTFNPNLIHSVAADESIIAYIVEIKDLEKVNRNELH